VTKLALRTLAVVALALALSGCGSDHPETVSVSGRITYGGGEWPKPGRVFFAITNPAKGLPGRSVFANFDTDGDFAVESWEGVDGLVPGSYKVTIHCWEEQPTMDGNPGKSYVPTAYQLATTTPLELTIEPGQDAVDDLQWDVPKP
jgi:hypothetical protein